MSLGWLIGIDGGGSKTLALVADERGEVVGRGLAGASNYHSTGIQPALASLEQAVTAACDQAGIDPGRAVTAVVLGMAGAGREEDRAPFEQWARDRFPAARVRLVSDAALVFAAGTAGWGLAIISGTGSIVYGQDRQGNFQRAGGWGYRLGDEGSGYQIGLAGLQAVARAWDGLEPPTALTERILQSLGLRSPPDLIRYISRPETTPAAITRLARLVEACALEGDQAALRIYAEAAEALARAASTVSRRLDLPNPVPAAFAGGMLIHQPLLRDGLTQRALALGLRLDPIDIVMEPALGAVRLAAGLADEAQA